MEQVWNNGNIHVKHLSNRLQCFKANKVSRHVEIHCFKYFLFLIWAWITDRYSEWSKTELLMKEQNGKKLKAIKSRWNKFQIMAKNHYKIISFKKFSYKYTLNAWNMVKVIKGRVHDFDFGFFGFFFLTALARHIWKTIKSTKE